MAPWESVAAVHEPPGENAGMRHSWRRGNPWGRFTNRPGIMPGCAIHGAGGNPWVRIVNVWVDTAAKVCYSSLVVIWWPKII